jgi:hypothetical protein
VLPTVYLVNINQTVDTIVNLDYRVGGIGFLDHYNRYYLVDDPYLVLVGE